ncbi:unnamed protein product [Linum trigynum]|uniref:Uncharacterized protein n=1 Tax=Linum trigynum TaxID=586398 RepID=A0AAV2FYW8_9ROSI
MGHNCCTKQKVKKGLWSPDEDEKLFNFITSHGHPSWSSVPKLAGLQRCGKSCRLRWINYLRPDLKRGGFTAQEERRIIEVHRMLGNRWAQISKHLPGRTDNEIKNFWNSYIKKKLIAQGLDPNTHNLLPTPTSPAKTPHQSSSNSSSSSSSTSTLVFGDQTTPSRAPVFLPIFQLSDIPTTTTTTNLYTTTTNNHHHHQHISFHVPPATEMDVNNGFWGYGAPGLESKSDVVRIEPSVDGVDLLRRRLYEEEEEYKIMEGSFEGLDFDFGEAAATNSSFFGAVTTNGTAAANYGGNYAMWHDVL